MERDAIITALEACVTQAEADAALAQAERWLATHPDDLDLRGACESAAMVSAAWDMDLEDWPQESRDALLRTTGHTTEA